MTELSKHFTARMAYEWIRDYYGLKWPHSAEMPAVWEFTLEQLTPEERGRACVRVSEIAAPYPPDLGEVQRYARGAPSRDELSTIFDKNPLIDGTSKWTADRETYEQRNKRKSRWLHAPHFNGAPSLSLVEDSRNVDE